MKEEGGGRDGRKGWGEVGRKGWGEEGEGLGGIEREGGRDGEKVYFFVMRVTQIKYFIHSFFHSYRCRWKGTIRCKAVSLLLPDQSWMHAPAAVRYKSTGSGNPCVQYLQ